jgi:hypothetical protein
VPKRCANPGPDCSDAVASPSSASGASTRWQRRSRMKHLWLPMNISAAACSVQWTTSRSTDSRGTAPEAASTVAAKARPKEQSGHVWLS